MDLTKESWIAALQAVADSLSSLANIGGGGLGNSEDVNWKAKMEVGVAVGVLHVRKMALQTDEQEFGETQIREITEHLMGLVQRVRTLTDDEDFISAVLDALEPINVLATE
jgi:hypothetical protein